MRSLPHRALLPLCTGLLALTLVSTCAIAATVQTTPSTTPYTIYSFGGSYTELYSGVCYPASTPDCAITNPNSIDTFGYIGAVIEGETTVNTAANTVTHKIFVVDQAAGTSKTAVVLDIYQLVTPLSGGAPAISKLKSITLPLTGGVGVKTFMAGNSGYLYIGTSKSPVAVKYAKASNAVSQVGGFTPAITVSSITANRYGFVTVSFGGLTATNGNFQFAPDGSSVGNGSGALFMLDTMLGTSTFDIPLYSTKPATKILARSGNSSATTQASTAPDAGLYISYGTDSKYKNITASVCGSVTGSSGCYGNVTMGAFGRVGAMVEGNPAIDKTTNTVTRDVWVVDQQAPASAGGPVVLYDYQIAEAIAAPNVTVTVTRKNSLPLSLAGGSTAKTYMAATSNYLYIGNSVSYSMAWVNKATLAAKYLGGNSPPVPDGTINTTADGYTVTNFSGDSGFFFFDPTGTLVEDGGGGFFMAGTTQALSISDVTTAEHP